MDMIIDAHVHLGVVPSGPKIDRIKLLKDLLKEARQNKISRVVIISGFRRKDVWDSSTSEIINLAKKLPNVSVVGSIDVVRRTKGDLAQLERWLKTKAIVGTKIYTGYQHIYPSDKRCAPIYRLCQKYNVPVIFHSGDTLAGYVANPKIKYSHPIHIDEVATDFPKLKIIIAHMGNPWLVDCAEVLYKNPNVYADISGLVVGKDLKTPYGKLMKRRIEELIAYVGSDKLLYGTDWPLCPMKEYLRFVNALRISKAAKEKLFSQNAKKAFNF